MSELMLVLLKHCLSSILVTKPHGGIPIASILMTFSVNFIAKSATERTRSEPPKGTTAGSRSLCLRRSMMRMRHRRVYRFFVQKLSRGELLAGVLSAEQLKKEPPVSCVIAVDLRMTHIPTFLINQFDNKSPHPLTHLPIHSCHTLVSFD